MSYGELEIEARVLGRYLVRAEPPSYVVGKYIDYHRRHPQTGDRFDRFLLALSSRAPFLAAVADSYCSRFCKQSLLRRKLVLLLALLECSAESSRYLDSSDGANGVLLWATMGWHAGLHVLALAVSLIVVLPVHVLHSLRGPG